jgi:hypothetical protein
MVAWQPPNGGSRPVPIGSQSIGVSLQPAIPRRVAPQQSPLPLHQSPTIVAQIQSSEPIKLRCSTPLRDAGKLVLLSQTGMSSLLCRPGDISILRRHGKSAERMLWEMPSFQNGFSGLRRLPNFGTTVRGNGGGRSNSQQLLVGLEFANFSARVRLARAAPKLLCIHEVEDDYDKACSAASYRHRTDGSRVWHLCSRNSGNSRGR